jgi:hypothetical protein
LAAPGPLVTIPQNEADPFIAWNLNGLRCNALLAPNTDIKLVVMVFGRIDEGTGVANTV